MTKNGEPERTFDRNLWCILPVSVAGDEVFYLNPSLKLFCQQIKLVQKQNDLGVLQDRVGRDLFPQLVRILKTVSAAIFNELLVKDTDWGEEDDGVDVLKEGGPRGS